MFLNKTWRKIRDLLGHGPKNIGADHCARPCRDGRFEHLGPAKAMGCSLLAGFLLCIWTVFTPCYAVETEDLGLRTSDILTIENEFIKVIVNNGPKDLGRFSLETTGGDPQNPSDNNQPLIFGRPLPWTSYTTLWIDGAPYIFGSESEKLQKRSGTKAAFGKISAQYVSQNAIITVCDYGAIEVTQHLSFFRNPNTKINDSVLISYSIMNKDTASHNVGVRLMLDTMLGANDGAPFRIGDKAVESEERFSETDLFDYWQTFDSLTSPNVGAQGTLKFQEAGVFPPNHVYLANWGTLADNPWQFPYQKGRSFIRSGEVEKDTALALFWEPKLLLGGEQFSIKTVYGLAGISTVSGELSLGLTAPAEIPITSKKEILIMGYIFNSGGFDSKDTVATFQIPEGFVISGGKSRIECGNIGVGETRQIPLKLRLHNAKVGKKSVGLSVESSTLEPNSIFRQIECVAPPDLGIRLETPAKKPVNFNPYFPVKLFVKNTSSFPIEGIEAQVKLDSSLRLPFFELPQKQEDKLNPGEEIAFDWLVELSPVAFKKTKVEVKVMSLTAPLKSVSRDIAVETSPMRFSLIPSRTLEREEEEKYFYVQIVLRNPVPFDSLNLAIQYDPKTLEYVRLTKEEWLRRTNQSESVSIEEGNIRVSGLKNETSGYEIRVLKAHFRSRRSAFEILLVEDDKVVDTIQIKEDFE